MKKTSLFILSLFAFIFSHAADNAGLIAARQLIERILPDHSENFDIEFIDAIEGKDVFEIESRGSRIILRGNTGVAVGSA